MTCQRAKRLVMRYAKYNRTRYVKRWICLAVCHFIQCGCETCCDSDAIFFGTPRPPIKVDFIAQRRIA